jgi:cysteine-S-conjugate beta-lyase
MPFFEVPKVVGRPLVEVPMARDGGRFELDLDGIDAALAGGAESVILCQPCNPLGRAYTRAELEALARVVADRGGRVVADEIHGPLTYSKPHLPYASVSEEAANHCVTLTSASKGWNLPGLKCAQVIITNAADEARWQQISRLRTHGASTIGIEANVAAYRAGAAWLDATLGYLDANRRLLAALLAELLPEVAYTVPEGTYLAWLDFGALDLDEEPAEYFLAAARVAMSPGLAFGAGGKGYARLNFATSSKILEQAVTAMADAVPR